MTKKILIIFSFLVFVSSCKKEDNSVGGNNHYDINENLYPLLFTPGSYWIYENQDMSVDSVILKSSEVDTAGPFNIGKGFTSTYEAYNLEYESSVYGEYQEQFVGYVISKGSVDGGYIYLSSFDVGETNDNATIVSIHNNMEIKGTTYNQVVEMGINIDDYISSKMSLFYVDSVGIVKKIIIENANDSITWQLIKHKTTLLTD